MKALFALAAVFLAGCATTPKGGMVITVPPERVAQCQAEGGCALVSQKQILEIVTDVADQLCTKAAAL